VSTSSASTPDRVRALLDTNVILDVLQRRHPFYDDSAAAMASAETGRIDGPVAAHSVATLFYLHAKHESAAAARMRIVELLGVLSVAAIDHEVLEEALAFDRPDYEDCVQVAAGRRAGADYVVTRDRARYAAVPLPTLTPGELLALLAG